MRSCGHRMCCFCSALGHARMCCFLRRRTRTRGRRRVTGWGVNVLPTLQFWRDGAKLWEHCGIVELDQDLAEGVP